MTCTDSSGKSKLYKSGNDTFGLEPCFKHMTATTRKARVRVIAMIAVHNRVYRMFNTACLGQHSLESSITDKGNHSPF